MFGERKIHKWLSLLLLAALLALAGCGDSDKISTVSSRTAGKQSCAVCHMDQDALVLLAEEEPEGTEDSGEG